MEKIALPSQRNKMATVTITLVIIIITISTSISISITSIMPNASETYRDASTQHATTLGNWRPPACLSGWTTWFPRFPSQKAKSSYLAFLWAYGL